MRKLFISFLPALLLLGLSSCEQDMEVYHESHAMDRLNFVFPEYGDTLITHTFVYHPAGQEYDTLWMELQTTGYVTDYPREFQFDVLPVDSNAAVAGKHYIAFDDETMKGAYVVPANQNMAKVPLVVKRDPSLKEKQYVLRIAIGENANFKPGFPKQQVRTYVITDQITRPKNWTGQVSWYCFGKYGDRKYQFMIDEGNKMGVTLNEDFFHGLVPQNPPDMAYCNYWGGIFREALKEENAARQAQGLDILREEPKPGQEVGDEIYFESYRDME